jgi:hypothetical protein
MKGYIYAIRSHQTSEIYIGSTTQMLCNRMTGHRRNCKRWKNKKTNYERSNRRGSGNRRSDCGKNS